MTAESGFRFDKKRHPTPKPKYASDIAYLGLTGFINRIFASENKFLMIFISLIDETSKDFNPNLYIESKINIEGLHLTE